MPGFDHTGPAGQGPMTGRRMGQCRKSERLHENRTEGNRAVHGNFMLANETCPGPGMRGGRGFGKNMGRGRAMKRGFGNHLRGNF